MRHAVVLCSLVITLMISCQMAFSQIPRTLSYQGVLTDTLGNPKPDGSYSFTFRLYAAESGGSAVWTEAKVLEVRRGLFSTHLGDLVSFGAALTFDRPYWLSMQVGGLPEMSPRIPLTAVGYSMRSLRSDTANYVHNVPDPDFADSARIAGTVRDNAVTSAKIQNGTILFADMAQNGAAAGEIMKWNGTSWSAAPDATGSGGGGGWTDDGSVVRLTNSADTVALNTVLRLGKLNLNGDIGLGATSNLFFGSSATRITGLMGGNLRLVAADLSALTTEDITFGHFGDETWIKFDNANKRVGIGTLSVDDRLHVDNSSAASSWMRVESSHPSSWGQAGLRIKTPQNMWNLRMDTYANANIPAGGLSLYSQDGGKEAMTWLEDGRVGIGTVNPSRKLHVNGSAQVKDTLYADVVNAANIVKAPGVAHSVSVELQKIQDTWTALDTVVIDAPGPGFVLLLFTGHFLTDHDYGDYTNILVGIASSPTGAGMLTYAQWLMDDHAASGGYGTPLALHAVATVSSSGLKRFYVVSRRQGAGPFDAVDMGKGSFSALFVSASYGTVRMATNPQPPDVGIGGHVDEISNESESVESRLSALTRELQSLRDQIDASRK